MSGYRVLDIETVVDDRYWERPPAKWKEEPLPAPVASEAGGVMGMMMSVWKEEEPFPPPQAHRVVAMAWVNLSADDDRWYSLEDYSSDCGWGYGDEADEVEAAMLRAFGEEQSAGGEAEAPTLVTWNGRTFDLPVINLRSFLHRIPCKWYYAESDLRYRYTEACHCDLMDVFSDYGAARSMKLGDVARLAGLPGKIGSVKGGNVGEIYKLYDPSNEAAKAAPKPWRTVVEAKAAIGAYCLLDAMQTAVLFARSRVHKGMIDQAYYDRVVAPSFADALASCIRRVKEEVK
jgi:predicted PolB exonuclease-like 3'-5' exonuclease